MNPRIHSLLLAASLAIAPGLAATPYTPGSPDEVVGHLIAGANPAAERALRALQARLKGDPQNLDLACQVARELVLRARATSDPRHLSYAEVALRPWWNLPEPPLKALVLRATIKQSLHQFEAARADLGRAVALDASDAQAWLTLATIDLVQGRFDAVRRSCFRLLQLGQEFPAVTVASSLGAMTGQAKPAAARLDALLRNNPAAAPELRRWALTLLGEIQTRLGHAPEAERAFRAALALDATDAYLLGAWGDFLLDQRRPAEAIDALAGHELQDALLLRLAEARRMRDSPEDRSCLAALVDRLDAGFAAGRLRPRFIHQREEARYYLRLKDDPGSALKAALENWKVQREAADIRVVLEAAAAAGRPEAAQPVLAWIRQNGSEDVAFRPLAERLAVSRVADRATP